MFSDTDLYRAQCVQLSEQVSAIFNKILMLRGIVSLKALPQFLPMPIDVSLAANICYMAHNGTINKKSGEPYYVHPTFVASQFSDPYRMSVGYLHDVVEDTGYTTSDLRTLGVNNRVVEAVGVLTKPKEMQYLDYLKRVRGDELALDVKLADLCHNSDYRRLVTCDARSVKRMEKYRDGMSFFLSTFMS